MLTDPNENPTPPCPLQATATATARATYVQTIAKAVKKSVVKMFRLHGPLPSGRESSSWPMELVHKSAGGIADRYRGSFICKSVEAP